MVICPAQEEMEPAAGIVLAAPDIEEMFMLIHRGTLVTIR
ncbi:hypothetical protein AMD24_00781 [Candidatus Xiphinematobacter sp. Idaho Grape]|nr:hypothetical protein AMD24_00781 [Candidatus Xiphinematobacter sp. Idaho Grape]